jgi:hypothetical protein
MRVIDLENKANEIEIMNSIWFDNNHTAGNIANLPNQKNSIDNRNK